MIVHEHNGSSRRHNRNSEYLSRMNKNGVEYSNAHEVMPDDPPPGIEKQDDEAFTLRRELRRRRDMKIPICHRFIRSIAQLQMLGCRTFPKRNQLPFLRLFLTPA